MHAYVPDELRTAPPRSRSWWRAPAGLAGGAGSRVAQPVLLAAGGVRSRGVGRSVSRDHRSRRRRSALPLSRHGRADRHAGVRQKRSGGGPGDPRVAAVRDVALRPFGISDRPVAAAQGRAEPYRAGRDAAPLHRQHRRRGGRERDQVGAPQSRHDVGRRRRRLHRVVRRRLSRAHAGKPGGHPSQEGATRLPDVRLAAHFLPGRGDRLAQGDGAPRGAQSETAVGSAGVGPVASCREEQGYLPARDGRARRVLRARPTRT